MSSSYLMNMSIFKENIHNHINNNNNSNNIQS